MGGRPRVPRACKPRDAVSKPIDLFWPKVDITPGCWLWKGYLDKDGYGQLYWGRAGEQSSMRAHRFAYSALVGPIPAGLLVCHRCDVPACVNPDHLFLGTVRDNALDKVAKGRHPKTTSARKTHCKRGHPLDQAYVWAGANGFRTCRPCNALAARRSRERRRSPNTTKEFK